MRLSRSSAAWIQGATLIAAVAAITAVVAWEAREPFDRETLKIEVEQLQSHAAETGELVRNANAQRLAPVFTRAHANQLAEKVHAVQSSLHSVAAIADLHQAQVAAEAIAQALEQGLQAIAVDGRSADAAPFDGLAARSKALAEQLAPDR